MPVNILTTDIGDVLLKPISLGIENQQGLSAMCAAEYLATQVYSELKRHVETRERGDSIQFCSRQVVDRVS